MRWAEVRGHSQGIDRKDHVADCVGMARFTSANAGEMAARSHDARRQRAIEIAERAAWPQTTPQIIPEQPAYVAKRLARVREQLDLLDKQIESLLSADKVDYQAVERAARSSASLAEQERNLDGRPLPGSMRPRPERRRAAPPPPGPLD